MKTVLIYVYDCNIVRNILRTNVLTALLASEKIRTLVILVHAAKLREYSEEFVHQKIRFEAYPPARPSWIEWVAWFLIRQTIPTKNVRIKISEALDRSPTYKLTKYVLSLGIWWLSHGYQFRKLFRFFLLIPFRIETFSSDIDKYKPDLVFLPTIYDINDIRLHKLCKHLGIKTVGMVKSWDNLLGKDALVIFPDRLIVHCDYIRQQAITLNRFPSDRIFITGIPQYDVYADSNFPLSKEEFFKEMGLDPNKRLIVYTCMGTWLIFHELKMVESLAELVNSGTLAYPSQLLVRLHPAYLSEDEELKKIPGIILDRPGHGNFEHNSWRVDFEFDERDTRRLVNTMKYADVVINTSSTIVIDAAAFNTPVVNIAFDPGVTNEKYERSARRFMDKDHYRPVVDSGAVTVVYEESKLPQAINTYLHDRTLHHEQRARLVKELTYTIDGHSGERVAEVVLGML